ncbi:response regulator transcription factor [Sulfurimonas sp.]|uniref:response regulator transcription factor n=1 Tax=Sulfurimonas sp. TaxID=2022749 RepID=UPI003D103BEB
MSEKIYDLLYVEDEIDVRGHYVEYLERFFRNVYEAANAKEALEVYKNKKPAILIVDINLPDKSGIEFLQEIRKYDQTTKAIMLTANSDVQTLLNATELKLTKYLVKPVSRADLKEAIALAQEELSNYTVVANKIVKMKDSFCWDKKKQVLLHGNEQQHLTKKERELLTLLFSDINRIFSVDDIVYELWYDSNIYGDNALKTLIKGLRKKLPEGSIKNIFGVGYKIEI